MYLCVIKHGRVMASDAWVVKIGGSLAEHPRLREWLVALRLAALSREIVIVAGGGSFAKSLRPLQQKQSLTMEQAHHLAIRATELYGEFLCALEPVIKKSGDIGEMEQSWKEKRPALWMPFAMLKNDAKMKPHWQVTSDSIAAHLASLMKASLLLFVKSREPATGSCSLEDMQKEQLIDRGVSLYTPACCPWLCLDADNIDQLSSLITGDASMVLSSAFVIDTSRQMPWRENCDEKS